MQPIPKHSGPCSFAKPCSACWKEYERKYFERIEKMKADRMAGLTLKQIGERYGLSSQGVLYHVGRGTSPKKPCSGPCAPEKLCSACHSRQYQRNYSKGIKGPARPPQQIPTLSEAQIEEMKTAKRNGETLQSIGKRYGVPRSRVRDFIGKIRKQREKRLDPRQEEMMAMRSSGMTLREIGNHLNVTGEYVWRVVGKTGRLPRPPKWPRAYFEKVMKQWLWDAGYRRCYPCGLWTSECSAAGKICRECRRKRNKEYAMRGDRQKSNKQRRQRYQELVATPEGRDKIKKRNREYYLRKKAIRERKPGNEEKNVQQESDGE